MSPPTAELGDAAVLGGDHGLTFYDATYAAVARRRGARLATLDRALLRAGLGEHPSVVVAALPPR